MESSPILFDTPSIKGNNREREVRIKWQDDFETTSMFKYYGEKTRNEHRITRFGYNFPFLNPAHTGDLFVLAKLSADFYFGYIFSTEDEINSFFDAFGMSLTDVGKIIPKTFKVALTVEEEISKFIMSLTEEFPSSYTMSEAARTINDRLGHNDIALLNPDKAVLDYTAMEYRIFRMLELSRYGELIKTGFTDVENFINVANTVLNRRKSRAGRSLENHLASIFNRNELKFEQQVVTEANKRPDFIFPDSISYHDFTFPTSSLFSLAAKTTCKDRWRQILNESNRIDKKHLFTLQQSISSQQLSEMEDEGVILVVPKSHIETFAPAKRDSIWSLSQFINVVKQNQNS